MPNLGENDQEWETDNEDEMVELMTKMGEIQKTQTKLPRPKKTISKRSYMIQIRPILRAVFSPYNSGSNTTVCSIEYDNITPALRGTTADIRCPCMAVILPLLKRFNSA
ncbi:unnamed protein product [Rotaria magnacalcarata]|uniref:Uncharacterized protein n=1 Tax=Rotaria magnacalcarata TaxID=392030 RepID=A0A8S2RE24_9BILA|nr:unnamed protein product [Rotaria magnacalcarata]CAF4250824.1 unnamed protein product [Rotaria magnacalcarata]